MEIYSGRSRFLKETLNGVNPIDLKKMIASVLAAQAPKANSLAPCSVPRRSTKFQEFGGDALSSN